VLLGLLALHGAGILHTHATAADHHACVACQVSDNQALDLPDLCAGSLPFLFLLLFLIVFRHRDVVSGPESIRLPHSRAPPAFS
jgi:hypothetical protein